MEAGYTTFKNGKIKVQNHLDDGAQLRTFRPVTPYPGSPLYYYAIETDVLKDAEDF